MLIAFGEPMVKVSKHSSNTELTFLFARDYKVH